MRHESCIKEYAHLAWAPEDFSVLGVTLGDSKYQSFFEFCMVLLSLMIWGDRFTEQEVAIIGDSTSALQDALELKGLG